MLELIGSVGALIIKWAVVLVTIGITMKVANGRSRERSKKLANGAIERPFTVFLHPDLGLGGAERLVVDAAVGLQQQGCNVLIYTNYHDTKRAFKETTDGTLKVITVFSWIPRSIAGKGLVLFATLRMVLMAFYLCLPFGLGGPSCDCYFVDQVAGAMVPLKLLTRRGVFFYCHHPDQLTDPNRVGAGALQKPSLLRRLYRAAFDNVEEFFMRFSDRTVCNSQYTRNVTRATFPSIAASLRRTDVLYPPINMESITAERKSLSDAAKKLKSDLAGKTMFLSLNRYERKKNINLAIEAFGLMLQQLREKGERELLNSCHLVVAGGWDERLVENVEHHQELIALAKQSKIPDTQITFLRSISDHEKYILLSTTTCVLYTPSNEHFGIVPLEAMTHQRVVLAVNNGGPMESISSGDQFGFLREPVAVAWAEVMMTVAQNDNGLQKAIGTNAKKRCEELFSLGAFSRQLLQLLRAL